jgi:hypothetical protein
METLWHLRAALNVAALSCREPQYALMGPSYNQLLKKHKVLLASANRSEGARYGNGGASDRHQTQLYNYFAGPVGKAQLCWSASNIFAQIGPMNSIALQKAAPKMLAELEAPFLPVPIAAPMPAAAPPR